MRDPSSLVATLCAVLDVWQEGAKAKMVFICKIIPERCVQHFGFY